MSEKMTRRTFLSIGSKHLLSALTLTACGHLLNHSIPVNAQPITIEVDETRYICDDVTLADQEIIDFIYQGKQGVLLYNNGEIRAFENICTHRGGPTVLHNGVLTCAWHGSEFDVLTGEQTKGPAPEGSALTPIRITEVDGYIYVV